MRHIVSTCTRILGVLAMLILFAGPLHADPVVIFEAGGNNPIVIPAPNVPIGPFVIDDNGQLRLTFRNGSAVTFLDFHIAISPAADAAITGNGTTFFEDFTGTPTTINFRRGGGTGIRAGETVTVIFQDFRPRTTITEITGTIDGGNGAEIPEPASLLLLGTGVAGIVLKAHRRLKARKRG